MWHLSTLQHEHQSWMCAIYLKFVFCPMHMLCTLCTVLDKILVALILKTVVKKKEITPLNCISCLTVDLSFK